MKHPEDKCNEYQKEFLESCKPEDRRFHQLLFMVGNATVHYHLLAKEYEPTESDWKEWIDSLEEPMKTLHRDQGFDACKGVLNFTRFIMEKNDVGLEQFLKEHLAEKDLAEYHALIELTK